MIEMEANGSRDLEAINRICTPLADLLTGEEDAEQLLEKCLDESVIGPITTVFTHDRASFERMKVMLGRLGMTKTSQRILHAVVSEQAKARRQQAELASAEADAYARAADEAAAAWNEKVRRWRLKQSLSGSDANVLLTATRSDDGNAICMDYLYGDEFLYSAELGWMNYTGTHWSRTLAEAKAREMAKDTLRQRCRSAIDVEDTELLRTAKVMGRNIRQTLYCFQSMVAVTSDEFDNVPHLLNTKNGVVDVRTGEVAAHSASNRFSYCVNAEYMPGAYHDAPLWYDLTCQWFPDTAQRDYVQRSIGYSITGEMREECMFYVYGLGRAGKGTMVNTVQHTLGTPLAQGTRFDTFSATSNDPQGFKLAPFHNARLVVASESKKTERVDEAIVKQVTGRDPMQVAFKHMTPFTMIPRFKVWLMSNHPPKGDVTDEAFWYRLRLIFFPTSYMGKEDDTLKDQLMSDENMRAVLSWCVYGAMQWYRDGLQIPPSAQEQLQSIREAQDPLHGFMADCVENDPAAKTTLRALHNAYLSWCNEEAVADKYRLSRIGFGMRLAERGYTSQRLMKNGVRDRWIQGLRLVP